MQIPSPLSPILPLLAPILIAVLVLLGVSLWLARRRSIKKAAGGALPTQQPLAEKLILTPEEFTSTFNFADFVPLAPRSLTSTSFEDQPRQWQEMMFSLGARMTGHGVGKLYFAHGTFVGHDPFDIIELIEGLFPTASRIFHHKLMLQLTSKKDALLRDLATFTPDYVALAGSALNHGIDTCRFTWSSGNHHLARLIGAIELGKTLAANLPPRGQRILLVGHSHAGQLFAILTQLLVNNERSQALIAIAARAGHQASATLAAIESLRTYPLDMVTLGTPPRYQWALLPHHRLLHLINHRGSTPLGGTFTGLASTRDGDYVQQWGIAGSDSLCPVRLHADLNRELVAHLGAGLNLGLWRQDIKKRRRLPAYGHTILVDYHDEAKSFNCLSTLFGHGVYTRYDYLLYNMTTICDSFYPPEATLAR